MIRIINIFNYFSYFNISFYNFSWDFFIYFFHKLAPTKRQIAILSRQGDEPSLDFSLLIDELKAQDKDVQLKVLCKKLLKGFGNKPSYFFHLIGPQMHALATSKVAIIDGYCIGASVLKHKEELKVIQTWHAMGALKKFGHSILDTPEGSSKTMAKGMRMHANYDYILTSSRASRKLAAHATAQTAKAQRWRPCPLK